MDLDASQNWRCWDNLEQVAYQAGRRGAAGPSDTVAAKRRAPTAKELAASAGAYVGSDVVWLVAAAPAPCLAPRPGDAVTDECGTRYTVLEAALNALKSTWRLMTRNLALAYDLRDTIQVERSGWHYDEAGALIRRWPSGPGPRGGSVAYADVAARVQPESQDQVTDSRGIRGDTTHYRVIVAYELALADGDRLRWGDVYLDIRRYVNAERIDELPVIEADLLP